MSHIDAPGGNFERRSFFFTHRHSQWEVPGIPEGRWPWYHAASRQPASLNGTGPPEHGALSFICTVPYPLAGTAERPLGVSSGFRNAVPLISGQKIELFFTFGNRAEREQLVTIPAFYSDDRSRTIDHRVLHTPYKVISNIICASASFYLLFLG